MAKTDPTETFSVVSGPRSAPDGVYLGRATTDKVCLYGVTPITQRGNASQAAVGTTAASNASTGWSFTTSTQADGIVTLVNELRAAMVAIGAIKGSA